MTCAFLSFAAPAELGDWLAEHHASASELWVRIYKAGSGTPSVTWSDCVVEAIAFGWIDGQKRSLDAVSYLQRLTPRRPGSNWSKKNCEHATRLIAEGRMAPAGLAQVEAAKAAGRWETAYAGSAGMSIPQDFLEALAARPAAEAFFQTLDRRNLFAIYYRLHTAKRPETRRGGWPKSWLGSSGASGSTDEQVAYAPQDSRTICRWARVRSGRRWRWRPQAWRPGGGGQCTLLVNVAGELMSALLAALVFMSAVQPAKAAAVAPLACDRGPGYIRRALVPDVETARAIFLAVEKAVSRAPESKDEIVEVVDLGDRWVVVRTKDPASIRLGMKMVGGGELGFEIEKCDGTMSRPALSR